MTEPNKVEARGLPRPSRFSYYGLTAKHKGDPKMDTLIATASLTGAALFSTEDGFYIVCSCGKRLETTTTQFDAQATFRIHWTTKPYCTQGA